MPVSDPAHKKWWWNGRVSPGFQKFMDSLFYGLGRASAQVTAKKIEVASKRTFETQHKSADWSDVSWAWFQGFTKGIDLKRRR